MLEYSSGQEIQGPSAICMGSEEPWEDFVSRVVGEISICVPYANNGRVLRPIFGRLRPSSHRRIQRSKTIQFLNQFLQGSAMPIRKKGSQGMKYKNLPVLILSNYRLSECYLKAANDGRLNTLECRLEIVEIDSFIDFYKNKRFIL